MECGLKELEVVMQILTDFGFCDAVKLLKEELGFTYQDALRKSRNLYEDIVKKILCLQISEKEKDLLLTDLSELSQLISKDLLWRVNN